MPKPSGTPRVTPNPFGQMQRMPLNQAINNLATPGLSPQQAAQKAMLINSGMNTNQKFIVNRPIAKQ